MLMFLTIKHTSTAYSTQHRKIFIAFRYIVPPFSLLFSFFLLFYSLVFSPLLVSFVLFFSLLLSSHLFICFLISIRFFFSFTHPTNSFSTSIYLFYFVHHSFSHLVTLKLRTIINTWHVNASAFLAQAVCLSSPLLLSPLLPFKLSLSANQPSHPSYRALPSLQFLMLRPRYTRLKWVLMILAHEH